MTFTGKGEEGAALIAGAGGEPRYKKDHVLKTQHADWDNQFLDPPAGKTTVYEGTCSISGGDANAILSLNKSGGKLLEADFLTRWASHTNYSANGTSSASQDVTPGQDGWFRFGDLLIRNGSRARIKIAFTFPSDSNIWSVEMLALGENPSSQFCEYRTILIWDNSVNVFQNAYLSNVQGQGTPAYQVATNQGVPL